MFHIANSDYMVNLHNRVIHYYNTDCYSIPNSVWKRPFLWYFTNTIYSL